VIAFVLAFAALSSSAPGDREFEFEHKKLPTGKSYYSRTFVARTPSISLAAPGFDSERVWSGYDDWEPAIAIDPSSSYVYQMTTRYNGPAACKGCPFPVLVFRSSADGGNTWSADKFLINTKHPQNDPMIAVADNGTVYVAWLDDFNPGVKFMKSANHGTSWSTPISFTGKGRKPQWSDRPVLAISHNGQDVYIAFNASDSYVVASHNGGQSFSSAVKTNSDTRYWFHSGGAVASNGTVYFSAADFSQNFTGDSNVNILRSTNGGSSWTTTHLDTSKEMPPCSWSPGCYLGFFGPSAALALDSTDKLVIAYNAGNVAGAPQHMYVRSSTDGVSWSQRIEVSNGSSSVNNAFPAIKSGNTPGDFRVLWQDDRNGSNTAWNTWYRRSTNGGNTWSTEIRLSDQGNGAPYKTAAGYLFPYGDYFELAVDTSGRNQIIWAEGDSYDGPGGTWFTRGQ
jgi:hypothetical protein